MASAAVVAAWSPAMPASAATTYQEQEGHHGVDTFTNHHNASGVGPRIDPGAWVDVSCKVYDPYIASVNPDGYWYRIASAPWSDQYYSPANTFMNGDPWDGPYTHNTDFNVPDCGAAPASAPPPPPPAPSASVSLNQGPTAPHGYWYVIALDHFSPGTDVQVTCHDSVDPGGFRTFSLAADGAGHAASQSSCYSNDGPDHWVTADGHESNHVTWGPVAAPPPQPNPPVPPTSQPPGPAPAETCESFDGVEAPTANLSQWLLKRYEDGYSSPVVVPWAYFSGNPQFVVEAKSLPVSGQVVGWRAVFPSDMYFALGHFTINRTSEHCYSISDRYDFSWLELPFWLQQKVKSAIPFDIHSSGQLW